MRCKPFAAALGAAVMVLAGCGTDDADDVIGLRPSPVAVSGVFTTSVEAARVPGAGRVVTDSAGWVLYRSDADRADPTRSTCAGPCARTWPPVLTDGSPELDGVDPARIGNHLRQDGTRQLTLDGWPVHRFSGDRPGRSRATAKSWHPLTP